MENTTFANCKTYLFGLTKGFLTAYQFMNFISTWKVSAWSYWQGKKIMLFFPTIDRYFENIIELYWPLLQLTSIHYEDKSLPLSWPTWDWNPSCLMQYIGIFRQESKEEVIFCKNIYIFFFLTNIKLFYAYCTSHCIHKKISRQKHLAENTNK